MAKIKKVYTPGSRPPGRPKKVILKKKGSARKGNYRNGWNEEAMNKAIRQVQSHKMSVREAALEYGVKKSTLQDRVREKVTDKLGRPTVLEREEEIILVERLVLMARWGFPLTCKDLRMLVKEYLDSTGRKTRFGDSNMPGPDFVKGFFRRHPSLTVRSTNLIKRSRAALSTEQVGKK